MDVQYDQHWILFTKTDGSRMFASVASIQCFYERIEGGTVVHIGGQGILVQETFEQVIAAIKQTSDN